MSVKEQTRELSFFRPNGISELSPLYKIIETTIIVEQNAFHEIEGSLSLKKETCDKISEAAGISYTKDGGVRTEKLTEPYYGFKELNFIGHAQGTVTEPDGTLRTSSVCEYEFNVMTRAEMTFLKDEDNPPNKRKYVTDNQKKRYIITLLNAARSRANTGARIRVVRELTGMPTGFKNLFAYNDPDTATIQLHFKKVVANPENKMVLEAGLANMFGTNKLLYGKQTSLPEPVTQERNITPDQNRATTPTRHQATDDFSDISLDDLPEDDAGKDIITEITALLDDASIVQKIREQVMDELSKNPNDEQLFVIKDKLEKIILIGFLTRNKANMQLLPQTMVELNKFLDRLKNKDGVTLDDAKALKKKIEEELKKGVAY